MILCWQRHHVLIYLNIKEESDRREGKGRRCRCRTKIWQQDDLKKWTIRRTDIWQNGCFGNVDDHRVHITPNHQPPKMDVLLKTILHIILVAKKAIVAFMYDFSSDILVRLPNSSDDLCLLFCLILRLYIWVILIKLNWFLQTWLLAGPVSGEWVHDTAGHLVTTLRAQVTAQPVA